LPLSLIAQDPIKRTLILNAAVTTQSGHPVRGLKTENFEIASKNARHRIVSSTLLEGSASIGILIDTSGSAGEAFSNIRKSAEECVRASASRNDYFVMTFNKDLYPLVDLTDDRDRVLSGIGRLSSATPRLNTALYDSIVLALEKLEAGRYDKKVLVVITDGVDTYSRHTFDEVRQKIRLSNVLFYNLNAMESRDTSSMIGANGLAFMEDLADVSGGRLFAARKAEALADLARQAAQEIDNLYRIELETDPTVSVGKPEWRKLDIKVLVDKKSANVGKVSIRARAGYYATGAGK
jgi:VWFA-related protein